MQNDRFWRLIAVLGVSGLFFVGLELREGPGAWPLTPKSAHAGIAFHNNNLVFFTSSEDGRTVYEWRIDREKPITFREKYEVPDEIR